MDLYEYQARQLLEEQDIPTPGAIFAQNSHEVAEAADKIGYPCVIKAQVKIGHRGQAGGVKIAHNRDEAILESESILPMTIHGHKVSGVLVAEAKNILHEYYVSISVDRTSRDFDVLCQRRLLHSFASNVVSGERFRALPHHSTLQNIS